MVENGFNLQRGLLKAETGREHYSVEKYKKITNFKQTKEILNNMKLELPDIPDIKDININKIIKEKRRNQILLLIGFFIVLFIIRGLVNLLDINSIKRNNII